MIDHPVSMNNLAVLYENLGKYALAEKYYLMANDCGCVCAINNLKKMYISQARYSDVFILAKKYNTNINVLVLGKFA